MKRFAKPFKFTINDDSDSLKGACRRVNSSISRTGWNSSQNAVDQVRRRAQWFGLSSLDDLARNVARPALVPIVPEGLFDLIRRPPIEKGARGLSLASVHAHIERPRLKADPALGIIDLGAVEAQIEE